jgi:hypothetical protein
MAGMNHCRGVHLASAVLVLAIVPLLAADEPGFSVAGTGLLEIPSTATAPPGHGTLGLALVNADRDPQGLDIFDYDVAGILGVTRWLELYGHGVFSRVVSLPERPTLPPPPLDLLVARGAPVPTGPWHSLYFPIPYVNKRGADRFGGEPGDLVLGTKLRLWGSAGWLPAVATGFELKVPLTRKLQDLQSGAGTGAIDAAVRVTSEWRVGHTSLVASTAYTWVGAPPFGDRLIADGPVTDIKIQLPNRVDVGIGLRQGLIGRLTGVLEGSTVYDIGPHTAVVDQARPVDFLAGIQRPFGHLQVTLGWRYHGHDLQSMSVHPSSLATLVDVTGVTDSALDAYLGSIGLGGAVPALRPGSQRLVVAPPGAPSPPPGSRVVDPTYHIRSEHQVGYVLLFGWRF